MSRDMVYSVVYLGPPGTYSHQAASDAFPGTCYRLIPCDTISALFSILETSSADYAVIPIQNSIFGAVVETYNSLRLLDGTGIQICGQTIFEVSHSLLARGGSSIGMIRKVYSHEQALGQCRNYILKHLPGVQQIATSSTAAAAELLLSLDLDSAAIASKVCTQLHPELCVLDEGVQDSRANVTRFIIASVPKSCSTMLPRSSPSSCATRALVSFSPATSQSLGIALRHFPPKGSSNKIILLSTTRRPALNAAIFLDHYFFEFECQGLSQEELQTSLLRCIAAMPSEQGDASLLGVWAA